MSTASLILRSEKGDRTIPLEADRPCRIGRNSQNEVVLKSDRVSRAHAMLQRNHEGGYVLFDLGSRNGTFLNNRRLAGPTELHGGDTISIGEFVLIFTQGQAPAPFAMTTMHGGSETVTTFEVRSITVLVVDIFGFTRLSRVLGAERIAAVLASFNRDSGAILEQAAAWSVKYIGDAVMAVFVHQPAQSSISVVRSVLQCVLALDAVVSGLQETFQLPLPIRIGAGVNIGIASIGNLGSALAADHTALGDVVNKAFRLESSTRDLNAGIAFGSEIRNVLGKEGEIAPFVIQHNVQLKGYTEFTDVYAMSFDGLRSLLEHLSKDTGPG